MAVPTLSGPVHLFARVHVGMTAYKHGMSLSFCQTPPKEPTHQLHFTNRESRRNEKETEIKPVMCIEVMDLTLLFLNLPSWSARIHSHSNLYAVWMF